MPKTITLIDNYDSFTYNLVQYIGDLGARARVYRNDKITVEDCLAENPAGLMISPGPSDPDHAGICLDLVKAAARHDIPLLGVCLGHQAIGQAFGGKVVRADKPMHGKTSEIMHDGSGVLKSIPSPYTVTRYHSLIVQRENLPDDLVVTAELEGGMIMALRHKDKPLHGIQFHPESIATQHGHDILRNFLEMI